MAAHTEEQFEQFFAQFQETNVSLADFCDFSKIYQNVENIAIDLNTLNFLVGKSDLETAVKQLWERNPKVFNVLDILIAIRREKKNRYINKQGETKDIAELYKSPEGVIEFLQETGLADLLQREHIKNLVDYVFGVETGLDSNARKNRYGHIMEAAVRDAFRRAGIKFEREVRSDRFPAVKSILGKDLKRFDFVVPSKGVIYLIEANFYNPGGGSKPNEVARAYTEVGPKINSVPGFEFVWITDGFGWIGSRKMLEEAYINIPKVYSLNTLSEFIEIIEQ